MRLLMSFVFALFATVVMGQSTVYLRADSVRVRKEGGNSTLIIENATRDSTNGVLLNYGLGRTRFQRIRAISASQFVVGGDTVTITGATGVRLNEILAANGTNSIDNGEYAQTWTFNSLGNTSSASALKISSNNTTPGIGWNPKLFSIEKTGNISEFGALYGQSISMNATGSTGSAMYGLSVSLQGQVATKTAIGAYISGTGTAISAGTDSGFAIRGSTGTVAGTAAWFTNSVGGRALETAGGTIRFAGLGSSGAKFVKANALGVLYVSDTTSGGGGPIPINDLLAATGTNNIDNGNYKQTWTWNSLANGAALEISSSSTASDDNKLIYLYTTGANASSSKNTYGIYSVTGNTGSFSFNYGGYFKGVSGTFNYGLYAEGSTNGVQALATGGGGTGVSSTANGTSGSNKAIYGGATGSGADENVGLYGEATNGTVNYGVYIDQGISRFDEAINLGFTNKTATFTANAAGNVYLCDATSGAITVNLPAASGGGMQGRTYIIKKTDASGNAVTIDGNVSELIDGAATYPLNTQFKYVKIICDGSNWHVIGNN